MYFNYLKNVLSSFEDLHAGVERGGQLLYDLIVYITFIKVKSPNGAKISPYKKKILLKEVLQSYK